MLILRLCRIMRLEQAFGHVLRELRAGRGFSQEQLAFECGYHSTYISQLERGLKNPSMATVFHLARTLHLTPSKLVAMVEENVKTLPKRRS